MELMIKYLLKKQKNYTSKYKNNPKIKWKESLKKILDIKISRIKKNFRYKNI